MQKINQILNIFHDGVIEGIESNDHHIVLKLSCSYLANLVKPTNEYFYLTFHQVDLFEFHYWDESVVTDISALIDLNLEICHSELTDDCIKVSCYSDTRSGGELFIQASFQELRTQDLKRLTIQELDQIQKRYWNSINK